METKKEKIIVISIVLIMVLWLLFPGVVLPAETTVTFEKGKITEKITCLQNSGETYALYLPSNYSAAAPSPILVAFDPGGKALIPINLFKNAAEKYGYIVACPYNSKNGPSLPVINAMKATWIDLCSRFSIDKNRVFAVGFSGGSRVSTFFSMVIGNPVQGIIGIGAGLSTSVTADFLKSICYYGIVGYADFNYSEMVQLEDVFKEMKIPHRFMYYDSPHRWPPEEMALRALEWMEIQSMKKGIRTKDNGLIQSIYEKELKLAQERENSGDIFYAAGDYNAISQNFEGLLPKEEITKISEKAQLLVKSKEYNKFKKDEIKRLDKEADYIQKFATAFEQLKNPEEMTSASMAISRMGIRQLEKEMNDRSNPYNAGLAERLIYSVGAQAFANGETYIEAKDFKHGESFMEIALLTCKRSVYYPFALYDMATIYSQQKKKDKALKTLREAVEKGITNLAYIEQDKLLDPVRNTDEFKEIIALIKAKKEEKK